jgi:hypothetical protein
MQSSLLITHPIVSYSLSLILLISHYHMEVKKGLKLHLHLLLMNDETLEVPSCLISLLNVWLLMKVFTLLIKNSHTSLRYFWALCWVLIQASSVGLGITLIQLTSYLSRISTKTIIVSLLLLQLILYLPFLFRLSLLITYTCISWSIKLSHYSTIMCFIDLQCILISWGMRLSLLQLTNESLCLHYHWTYSFSTLLLSKYK